MSGYTLTSSGVKTADGVIVARPCRILSVMLDGVSATAIVYDNASAASGTQVARLVTPTDGGSKVWSHDEGVECLNGAYLDVTGTCNVIVHYAEL